VIWLHQHAAQKPGINGGFFLPPQEKGRRAQQASRFMRSSKRADGAGRALPGWSAVRLLRAKSGLCGLNSLAGE